MFPGPTKQSQYCMRGVVLPRLHALRVPGFAACTPCVWNRSLLLFLPKQQVAHAAMVFCMQVALCFVSSCMLPRFFASICSFMLHAIVHVAHASGLGFLIATTSTLPLRRVSHLWLTHIIRQKRVRGLAVCGDSEWFDCFEFVFSNGLLPRPVT
jgi:hypothetical protein